MSRRDIWGDFNGVHGGVLDTLARFAEPGVTLTKGAEIVVGDDEGYRARATVLSVSDEGLVSLLLQEPVKCSCGMRRP